MVAWPAPVDASAGSRGAGPGRALFPSKGMLTPTASPER